MHFFAKKIFVTALITLATLATLADGLLKIPCSHLTGDLGDSITTSDCISDEATFNAYKSGPDALTSTHDNCYLVKLWDEYNDGWFNYNGHRGYINFVSTDGSEVQHSPGITCVNNNNVCSPTSDIDEIIWCNPKDYYFSRQVQDNGDKLHWVGLWTDEVHFTFHELPGERQIGNLRFYDDINSDSRGNVCPPELPFRQPDYTCSGSQCKVTLDYLTFDEGLEAIASGNNKAKICVSSSVCLPGTIVDPALQKCYRYDTDPCDALSVFDTNQPNNCRDIGKSMCEDNGKNFIKSFSGHHRCLPFVSPEPFPPVTNYAYQKTLNFGADTVENYDYQIEYVDIPFAFVDLDSDGDMDMLDGDRIYLYDSSNKKYVHEPVTETHAYFSWLKKIQPVRYPDTPFTSYKFCDVDGDNNIDLLAGSPKEITAFFGSKNDVYLTFGNEKSNAAGETYKEGINIVFSSGAILGESTCPSPGVPMIVGFLELNNIISIDATLDKTSTPWHFDTIIDYDLTDRIDGFSDIQNDGVTWRPTLYDFNGDGEEDLILTAENHGQVGNNGPFYFSGYRTGSPRTYYTRDALFYENSFVDDLDIFVPQPGTVVVFADVDNDGKIEMVVRSKLAGNQNDDDSDCPSNWAENPNSLCAKRRFITFNLHQNVNTMSQTECRDPSVDFLFPVTSAVGTNTLGYFCTVIKCRGTYNSEDDSCTPCPNSQVFSSSTLSCKDNPCALPTPLYLNDVECGRCPPNAPKYDASTNTCGAHDCTSAPFDQDNQQCLSPCSPPTPAYDRSLNQCAQCTIVSGDIAYPKWNAETEGCARLDGIECGESYIWDVTTNACSTTKCADLTSVLTPYANTVENKCVACPSDRSFYSTATDECLRIRHFGQIPAGDIICDGQVAQDNCGALSQAFKDHCECK